MKTQPRLKIIPRQTLENSTDWAFFEHVGALTKVKWKLLQETVQV